MERLSGTVERVVFTNDESHFSVVRMLADGQAGVLREQVTAVGVLPGVQPGQQLRLRGQWERDSRFGRQFRALAFEVVPPSTREGIERYLASGMIKGIGKVMAGRLVERFGAATLRVIENEPERLREVEGIGSSRATDIRHAWEKQRGIQEVMVFLASHGVSPGLAARIFRVYGNSAVQVVRADPYRLADDVFGVGFKTADAIAEKVGIDRRSPRRAAAGILHMLSLATGEGHLFLRRMALLEAASSMLEVDEAIVEQGIAQLAMDERIVEEGLPDGDTAVFSQRLHEAETGLARGLRLMVSGGDADRESTDGMAIAALERELDLVLAKGQRDAIDAALAHHTVVITGGPGTGKTTVIRGVHSALVRLGKRVVLCAPTGRAARRLGEVTGAPASTIHRALEFSPRTRAFERNADNPLAADVVIVDEASMVDVLLAQALVDAIPAGSRLVLVGDVDQLPSVGPGTVLRDIIESGRAKVARLTEIFRQGQESLIVSNAHRIHAGQSPISGEPGSGADFFFIPREDPQAIIETIRRVVVERVPHVFGLHPIGDVQILTPMHRGDLGAIRLNEQFQTWLNPSGPSMDRGGRTFRQGDKVMQNRNNYDKEVFNGDVGRIERVLVEEREIWVRYRDRELLYEVNELDELELAYAITVHKSQGSEYPVVVLPLHGQHFLMLRRNLLYTAVTRGKKLVVICGSAKALHMAVGRNDIHVRSSLLLERLRATDFV